LHYVLEEGKLNRSEKAIVIDFMKKYQANQGFVNAVFGKKEGQFKPQTYIEKMKDTEWLDKDNLDKIRSDAKDNFGEFKQDYKKFRKPVGFVDPPSIKLSHKINLLKKMGTDVIESPMVKLSGKEDANRDFLEELGNIVKSQDHNEQIETDKKTKTFTSEKPWTDPVKTKHNHFERLMMEYGKQLHAKSFKLDIPFMLNMTSDFDKEFEAYGKAMQLQKVLDNEGTPDSQKRQAAWNFYVWLQGKGVAGKFYDSATYDETTFLAFYYPGNLFRNFPEGMKDGDKILRPDKIFKTLSDAGLKTIEKDSKFDLYQNYLKKVFLDKLSKDLKPWGIGIGSGIAAGLIYGDLFKGTDNFGLKSGNYTVGQLINFAKLDYTKNRDKDSGTVGDYRETSNLKWNINNKRDFDLIGTSGLNEFFTTTPSLPNMPLQYKNFNTQLWSDSKKASPGAGLNTSFGGTWNKYKSGALTSSFGFNTYLKSDVLFQNKGNSSVTSSTPVNQNQNQMDSLLLLYSHPEWIDWKSVFINGFSWDKVLGTEKTDELQSKTPTQNVLNVRAGASVNATAKKYFSGNLSYDYANYNIADKPFDVHRVKAGLNITGAHFLHGKLDLGANFDDTFTNKLSSLSKNSNIANTTVTLKFKLNKTYLEGLRKDNPNIGERYSDTQITIGHQFDLDKKKLLGMVDVYLKYRNIPATQFLGPKSMVTLGAIWRL
jgi:hypothetical protein